MTQSATPTPTPDAPTANDYQVGGAHYKRRPYQHWDFVADAGLGYFSGQATKYLARWRDKNGAQDLEKSLHYLRKRRDLAREERLPSRRRERTTAQLYAINRFIEQYADDGPTYAALRAVALWMTAADLESAIALVEGLLAGTGATPAV